MNIEINQKINKEYYTEYYSQWLKYKSKFKKWEHIIGFISLLLGLIIYLLNQSLFSFSIGLIIFGLLMVYEFYSSKHKWLKERMKSRMNNTSFKIIFKENEIETFSLFSETKGKWNLFSNVIQTEKGLILIPENGISIYLQNNVFKKESDIEEIIMRIKKTNANNM
jgi:hypothetical protein